MTAAGLALVDIRLIAIFAEYGVPEPAIATLGTAGVTSVAIMSTLASTRVDFREFLAPTCLLDPGARPGDTVTCAKLVSSFEACRVRAVTEIKANALSDDLNAKENALSKTRAQAKMFLEEATGEL